MLGRERQTARPTGPRLLWRCSWSSSPLMARW